MTKDRFEKLQDMLDTEFEETLDDLIEVEFNEPILSEEVRALYKKQHPKGLDGRISVSYTHLTLPTTPYV